MPVTKPAAVLVLSLASCLAALAPHGAAATPAQDAPPGPAAADAKAGEAAKAADPAANDAGDEEIESEVRASLAGLAGDDSKQRQRAEDAIVELGEPARAVVQRLLATPAADDLEVRTRLESAVARIDANRLTGPSFVTLRLKDATPAEAFSELSKQAFAAVRPLPDDLWQQGNWPAVTLDLRRQPFWVAVQELSAAAGVGLQPSNDGLRLVRGPGQLGGPSVVRGAFLVVATQVNRSQTIMLGNNPGQAARPPLVRAWSNEFGVHLLVLPEPKLSVIRVNSGVRLEQAVDDKGNDLALPANARGNSYASGMGGAWSIYARLNYPAENAGARIARLAGTATFVVQTKSEKIEIPAPLTLRDAFRVVGGSRVTFHSMSRANDRIELKVSLAPDGNAAGADGARGVSSLFQSVQSRLRVLDAAGRPLDRRGFSSEGTGREMRFTLHFAAPPAGAPGAGDPSQLVWDVPTEWKDVDVPFEFKDLPMP
ncbi:MAG: hypothetical protein AVDCRST_MAG64-1190 [uncultured Phycisphaerae bacterium]|uniref:Uncharacterized protein n=1 Tax=uncultured Phycisphaerae bacterium TaxID=904963 RepID=A0A6J4NKF3_9BACT|nr:MAG: hypothetical protein AVDCRST_MAG64-1190 [uncultured Phycisphaerae bacterium]